METNPKKEPLPENQNQTKKYDLGNIIKKENSLNSEDDLCSLINSLINFERQFKTIKDVSIFLTKENVDTLKSLLSKENIKINIVLGKIYMDIISNDSLYNIYLTSIDDNDNTKISLLLEHIEICILLIEKLNTFVFSSNLFIFKNKILELIKCIYYNCKSKIKNIETLTKIIDYMNSLPSKFFSESYLELNKTDLHELYNSKSIEKILEFEENFSRINNFFEQYSIFKKFVKCNTGANYTSIERELSKNVKEEKKENEENKEENVEKYNFYEQYGSLILKFCRYHKYMFLIKEEEKEGEEKEKEEVKKEQKKEKEENKRTVFLLDKDEKDKKEEKSEKGTKIVNTFKNKQLISLLDTKEYKHLIKKAINYYLKLTKDFESVPKLKKVREHLSYYLSTVDVDSFYPLYLNNISQITISDNFTPSFLTNIPASTIKKFYFETPKKGDSLVYIEFFLEDNTKNINIELNKYDENKNKFISLFKEEKVCEPFKFLILCNGYSLYELVFDNYFSWFNSKDINYRLTILKFINDNEKQYDYIINGRNYCFNKNEVNTNKQEKEINIPVVIYLNQIKFCLLKNEGEKEKEKENEEEDELVLKEYKEEDEKIIPKHLFNYLLINHIKKNKIVKDKNSLINILIFSQNSNLLSISEDLNETIKSTYDEEKENYIKSLGFFPDEKIEGYTFNYKLFSLNEQTLFYHMHLNINKDSKIGKSILLIEFDKLIANALVYSKGEIYTKLKDKEKNFNNMNINNIDEILDLIKKVSDSFDGLDIILRLNKSVDEEDKVKISEKIGEIKKFCQEKINPPIKINEYDINDISNDSINFLNYFIIE